MSRRACTYILLVPVVLDNKLYDDIRVRNGYEIPQVRGFSKITRSQDSRAAVPMGKSSEVVFVLVWRESRSGNFFFSSHPSTFQPLDKPWSQVSSLLPPGPCFQLLSRTQGSAIPLLFVDFSSSVANSRSCAFRNKSKFVHKKMFQRIYTSMHSAGLELTKETDQYQARSRIT